MKSRLVLFSDIIQLINLFAEKPAYPHIFNPYDRLVYDETVPTNLEGGDQILVNLAGKLTEFKGMPLENFDLILDFGEAVVPENFESQSLNYIHQPQGGMRWLYQRKNLNNVLAFYNGSGRRGKFFSKAIQWISKLGLGKLVANGNLKIYGKNSLKLNRIVSEYAENYSIFMGTPGLQRSILVALIKEGSVNNFIKIPTNEASTKLIENEKVALEKLTDNPSAYLETPKVFPVENKGAIGLSNVQGVTSKRSSVFTPIHSAYMLESFKEHGIYQPLKQSAFWKQIKTAFQSSRFVNNPALMELAQVGNQLFNLIDENDKIWTHWAHGDFTPWNMYLNDNKIALYDWEMHRESAPAFYDLFHFHYQSGILMEHIDHEMIQNKIKETFKNSLLDKLVNDVEFDMQLHHRLYLLSVVSYFIQVYAQQTISIQNEWQINCWLNALKKEYQLSRNEKNCRKKFILDLNDSLEKVAHAYLKFDYPSLLGLPESSDLDIAIEKSGVQKVVDFCDAHALVKRFKHRKRSFMSIIEIHLVDGSYVSLDLIHSFKRKHLTMLSVQDLLKERFISCSGISLPSIKHDLAYAYAFYTLNNAPIPLRYHQHFLNRGKENVKIAIDFLNKKYTTSFESLEKVFTDGLGTDSAIKSAIRERGLKALKGKFNYLLDTLKDLIGKHGFIVTFSGVDGAGKSTVIDIVKRNIERKYRKQVVLLRHRPGILPILSAIRHGKSKAEQIASETLPRKGANRSKTSSALRFTYYYTDYLIGQVYVYFKYVLRGKIVLYDRYYFDFINDAKRSNIQVNRNIAKALYTLITKPKLNFFLYADPETILARKQELNAADIQELSSNYNALFTELKLKSKKSTYTSIENNILDETIASVLKVFSEVA